MLSRSTLDDDAWEELEDTLLAADVGVTATDELVANLKTRVRVEGIDDPAAAKAALREELVGLINPTYDRTLDSTGLDGKPGVVLVVGVNGTGKTTTVGRLARVLVAEDKTVVLGAADTFRAAAADQLQTWGERVGVPDRPRRPRAATPRASDSRPCSAASPTAPTSCWSTPPAGCTPRPASWTSSARSSASSRSRRRSPRSCSSSTPPRARTV